jgi:hypothetical protein
MATITAGIETPESNSDITLFLILAQIFANDGINLALIQITQWNH